MLGSHQATLGDETKKKIQAKLSRHDFTEQQLQEVNDEIDDWRKLAWNVKPPGDWK